jgi:protein-tyrosine phosphatase
MQDGNLIKRAFAAFKAIAKRRISALFSRVSHWLNRGTLDESLSKLVDKPDKSVVFVCMGNVCRSPFAAEYARRRATLCELEMNISSAGVHVTAKSSPKVAQRVAREFGVQLDNHSAQSLQSALQTADMIITFDGWTWGRLAYLFPRLARKTYLLSAAGWQREREILDPWAGNEKEFRHCYSTIAAAIDSLFCRICPRALASGARQQFVIGSERFPSCVEVCATR